MITAMSEKRFGNAKQLWYSAEDLQPNRVAFFRREIELDAATEAVIHIHAESRYRLYVDGEFLGEGPPPSFPGFEYYDSRSVPLSRGCHCIAVMVRATAHDLPPAFVVDVRDENDSSITVSDRTWRAKLAEAWSTNTLYFGMNKYDGFQEDFDTRQFPDGWDTVGFDDSTWPKAVMLGDAPSSLRPRDISFMHEEAWMPTEIAATRASRRSVAARIICAITGSMACTIRRCCWTSAGRRRLTSNSMSKVRQVRRLSGASPNI